jgi:hypothetical protein
VICVQSVEKPRLNMRSKITDFKIEGGRIKFEAEEFIRLNEGKSGEIKLKIVSDKNVKHHRHRYYRGAVLPLIAEESFSGDLFEAHIYLKKRFLFIRAESLSEIPERHKNSASIFIFDGEALRGVIPSCGNLTDDEMRQYVIQVEGLMFDLQASLTADQINLRKKCF